MKLTRLELSGFKSFAETVKLPFEDGITCVVGPNGCGKSNVSDAVRWVLGEQRARMLRSTKMDEVIFQGSAKRKPLNVSEVSLIFDNSDGALPIEYREVVVTRRLSRSGQSEYLVNQTPSRLRDVQDLLRGTGLGSDAGVVIEAKMIDRLLSDRPDERRSLFEEAAGIGLYRDRKVVTERRLDKTLEDLRRLDDLIAEVQTQVRSLARQRGKAERHRQFTEERFTIVVELARRELARFEETASQTRVTRDTLNRELPETREQLAATERQREAQVQERASAEAERTAAERRLSERRLEVGKLEGDRNLAQERAQNAATRKARAGEERGEVVRRAEQAQREREAAAKEREAAYSARASVQGELDLRTATEDETRSRLADKRNDVRELEAELHRKTESVRAHVGEQSALEHEIEELQAQAVETDRRRSDADRTLDELDEALTACRSELERREAEDRAASGRHQQARHALATAREREAAVLAERRTAEETLTQLSARQEALEALERDRAGLAPGAKRLLETRATFGDGTVLGPLSDYLRTTPDEASLAERVLSEWLHAVVVRDAESITAIRRWHRETDPGPILLLPLQPGPAGSGGNGDALDLQVEEPARAWAEALLAGNVTLDDEGHAIQRANGAVFLPGSEDAAGPLRRRAELDDLTRRRQHAHREVTRLQQAVDEAVAAHRTCEHDLAAAAEHADECRAALAGCRGRADDVVRERQRAERDRAEFEETLTRIGQRLTERRHRLETVREEFRALQSARAQIEAELEAERIQLGRLETEQEAARERRVHWQVEEAQVSARESAAREREERAEQALRQADEETARLDAEIAQCTSVASELETQVAEWSDRLGELTAEVGELTTAAHEAERAVGRVEEALTTTEATLESHRRRVNELTDRLHQLEIEETEIAGQRRALRERLEAEWHRPFDELLASVEPVEGEIETLTEEASRLAAAIDTIGPVNPLAAQEYEEESTRLEFLQTQRDDLMEARTSLLAALREIDQTAKTLFEEAFAAVSENFQSVFHTLFGGGECEVRLADPSDPLGSDIEIRAAPRGKRTQRIHLLSSGERALVALSLLFAIYLTKPSPFCLLDEVDAPLDDANVQRFIRLLTEFKTDTQFIVITHNPRTMQVADAVYGVTMQEPGVSTIVGVRLGELAGV